MSADPQVPSARREELLELAYAYVLRNGMAAMSLRPLAEAVGSSPRVLLYLFGSKDGLVRALLGRSRTEELALLAQVRAEGGGPAEVVERLWEWLAAPQRRDLLRLWAEGYARSLVEPDGPWAGGPRDAARSVAGPAGNRRRGTHDGGRPRLRRRIDRRTHCSSERWMMPPRCSATVDYHLQRVFTRP
jgi:AcrR family transcriptional regulator